MLKRNCNIKKKKSLSFLLWFYCVSAASHSMFIKSCSVFCRPGQHLRPHCDVFLLRPGCDRPSHAEVPVVEALPDVSAAGECVLLCMKMTVNVHETCLWSQLTWTSPPTASSAAVPAVTPVHGPQPDDGVRLPRLHEHVGVWLLHHPRHPLQQLLLSELPQQEEAEIRCLDASLLRCLQYSQVPTRGSNMPTVWRFFSWCS